VILRVVVVVLFSLHLRRCIGIARTAMAYCGLLSLRRFADAESFIAREQSNETLDACDWRDCAVRDSIGKMLANLFFWLWRRQFSFLFPPFSLWSALLVC